MALAGGIDATFGPCDIPDPNFKPPYSPAFTADRYVAPDVYMRLVQLNATVGMKTVVYDARLWSDDFATRDQRNRILATGAGEHRRVGHGRRVRSQADTPSRLGRPRASLGHHAVDRRAGHGHPAVHQLPAIPGRDPAGPQPTAGRRTAAVVRSLSGRLRRQHRRPVRLAGQDDVRGQCLQRRPRRCGDADLDAPRHGRVDRGGLRSVPRVRRVPRLRNSHADPIQPDTITEPTGAATELAPVAQEGSGHSSLVPIGPLRVLETRSGPGSSTYDGNFNSVGMLPNDSVFTLGIAGRPQLPSWARSVVLNVTVTGAVGNGYLTVYPCDEPRPTSSNLNYQAGITRAVAVVARIGSNGAVCIYTKRPLTSSSTSPVCIRQVRRSTRSSRRACWRPESDRSSPPSTVSRWASVVEQVESSPRSRWPDVAACRTTRSPWPSTSPRSGRRNQDSSRSSRAVKRSPLRRR